MWFGAGAFGCEAAVGRTGALRPERAFDAFLISGDFLTPCLYGTMPHLFANVYAKAFGWGGGGEWHRQVGSYK